MKQRETLQNEQARERIAMDCSCHKHARKPQPEDEFHKVVPGLSPSSRIFKNCSSCSVNISDKPGGLLSPWCMKSSKRPRILFGIEGKIPGWGVSRGSVDRGSVFCRNPKSTLWLEFL